MSAKDSSDSAAMGPRARDAGDVLAGILELWLSDGSPGRVGRAIAEEALENWRTLRDGWGEERG